MSSRKCCGPSEPGVLRLLQLLTRYILRLSGHPLGYISPISLILPQLQHELKEVGNHSCSDLIEEDFQHAIFPESEDDLVDKYDGSETNTQSQIVEAFTDLNALTVDAFDMGHYLTYATQWADKDQYSMDDIKHPLVHLAETETVLVAFQRVAVGLEHLHTALDKLKHEIHERYGGTVFMTEVGKESTHDGKVSPDRHEIGASFHEYLRMCWWIEEMYKRLAYLFVISDALGQFRQYRQYLEQSQDQGKEELDPQWTLSTAQWVVFDSTTKAGKTLLASLDTSSANIDILSQLEDSWQQTPDPSTDCYSKTKMEKDVRKAIQGASFLGQRSLQDEIRKSNDIMEMQMDLHRQYRACMKRLKDATTQTGFQSDGFLEEYLSRGPSGSESTDQSPARTRTETSQTDMKRNLLSIPGRKPVQTNIVEERVIKSAHDENAELTNELLEMTNFLRESSQTLGERIRRDNELLESASTVADTNVDAVKRRRAELALQLSGSAQTFGGTCAMLVTVSIIWIATYLLVKIVPAG